MKVVVDGKVITLVDRDVKTANAMINHFLQKAKSAAEEQSATTFYYTLLLVMKAKADERIKALTPEVMSIILNAAAETERIRNNMKDD